MNSSPRGAESPLFLLESGRPGPLNIVLAFPSWKEPRDECWWSREVMHRRSGLDVSLGKANLIDRAMILASLGHTQPDQLLERGNVHGIEVFDVKARFTVFVRPQLLQ